MPEPIADAISRLLDAHDDRGMDAHEVASTLQHPSGGALDPYEVDRTLQRMQLAGWAKMDTSNGHGTRRYRLTEAGRVRLASSSLEPGDLRS